MNIWENAPFTRLIPPLVTGILLGAQHCYSHPALLLCLAVIMITCFAFATRTLVCGYTWRWVPGLFINGLIIITGLLLYRQQQVEWKPGWLGNQLSNAKYICGTPESIMVPGVKYGRVVFIIKSIIDSTGTEKKAGGKIILYLSNSFATRIYPGDTWMTPTAPVQKIKSSNNPGEFDYAQYCARQNIFHQAFLQDWQFVFTRPSASWNLARILAAGQRSALKAMRETVPEKSVGLAMALLIGYRNEVDKSLLQAYTNTGVVHVIAVSGMHLGLIFLLLQKAIAFPVKKYKLLKWLKGFLVLLVIWLFSGIAGAAASIIRAAFMFTTTLLAKLLRKPMNNIQSICLGAFSLLCYNPLWLWDAGFQLSFAALLSIICYQPLITGWMKVKNPLLKSIWELAAVTLAAQVLTLPISIGQFHQAPVYFLAANLIAVPLSSIALITAILQWIVTMCGLSFSIPGLVTGILIHLMNSAILHLNTLPGAVINQLEWNPAQTIIAFLLIVSITIWLSFKERKAALLCLVCLVAFLAIRFNQYYQQSNQEQLLVFHVPHKRLVVILQGRKMHLLASEVSTENPDFLAARRFLRTQKLVPCFGKLLAYKKYSIGLPANKNEILPLLEKAPDILFLPGDLQNIEPVMASVQPRTTIIMDGKIADWKARQWRLRLKERQIKHFSTGDDGAVQIPLNKF